MTPHPLPFELSALAAAISEAMDDTNQLALLAAAMTQLADTLALIALQRDLLQQEQPPAE